MVAFKIVQIGLLLHCTGQVYYGHKNRYRMADRKILYLAMLLFTTIAIVWTMSNWYSTEDFGECGTKRFNPLTIIAVCGNLMHIAIYLINAVVFKVLRKVKPYN